VKRQLLFGCFGDKIQEKFMVILYLQKRRIWQYQIEGSSFIGKCVHLFWFGIGIMVNSVYSLILIAGIAAVLIFGISLVISTIGYSKKN
jgi:hypothetical protein